MAQLAQLTTAEYTQRFNDQVSAGANAAAQSMEKLANAFEVTEQRARRAEGSFSSLEARLDAGARLSQAKARSDEHLARQLDAINAAVARGAITQERANQLTELATQRQAVYVSQVQRQIAIEEQRNRALLAGNAVAVNGTAATNAFASANDNARQSSGRFGQAMGQAGFQIQDFATQVSMGQNALTAFGVQFAQFAGIFGTAGAIAGAVVTVGLLTAQLISGGDASRQWNQTLEHQREAIRAVSDEAERWREGLQKEAEKVQQLREYYRSLSEERQSFELRVVAREQAALGERETTLRRSIEGQIGKLIDSFNTNLQEAQISVRNLPANSAERRAGEEFLVSDASLQRMRSALEMLERFREEPRLTVESLAQLTAGLRASAGEMGRLEPNFRRATTAIEGQVGPVRELENAYRENDARLAALGLQAGGTANQLDTLRQRIVDLRQEALNNPTSGISAEIQLIQERATALRSGGLPALERVQRAQEQAAEARRIEERAIEDLRRSLADIGAAERDRAIEERRPAIRSAAVELVSQQSQLRQDAADRREADRAAQEAARNAEREADRQRREAEQARREEKRAQEQAAREAAIEERRLLAERERMNRQTTDEIVRYSADRFADLWSNTGRGFAGLMENMLQIVRRTFARIAAEAVIRPIVTPIVSNFVTPLINSFGLGGNGATAGTAGQASPGLFSGAINFSGLAGLAGLANFGGLPGIGGLGGIGSGISNFLNLPLFGSAAQASATNGALAALGPGVYGPATPASVGLAGTTVGGFLGAAGLGAGLGFAGGSITGALRGTADPLPGVLIGTGLGFVLGGPIGAGIGGAIGGLFGPTVKGNASRAGGDVFLGTDANGRLIITSARGKRWDQAGAVAEVQSQLDAINQQTAARGLTFAAPGQAAVGFGQASGSPRELSLTALVGQLRSDNANQMTAFGTLAGRGGNLEEALQAADFVTQVFEPLSEAEKKTGTFTAAMEALTKTYDDAIKKAKDLGLSEAGLQAQRAERAAKLEADRARDLSIIDRTLGARRATLAGDTRGASLTQFDLRAEEENRAFREQLRNLGFDEAGQDFARRMVELEQIVADERLAVMRQFDDQMRGISQGLLEQLTLGDLGGLAPEARFGAGLSLLNNAQAALADGATVQELAEFSRVAQNVLPIAKDFLGISSNYAELVADVSRTLRTAAPGSDPANLGAILEASLNGSDRVEMAILSTGQSQTTVLQTLLTELKRLTAQNEALLARAAA